MNNKKKTANFYLTVLTAVLTAANLVLYLLHTSDMIYTPVVVLMVLSIAAAAVEILKPMRYFEYVPMVLCLLAMFFYFSTEASYISVCYLAVDDSFTPEYLFQIALTFVMGIVSVIPPVLTKPGG